MLGFSTSSPLCQSLTNVQIHILSSVATSKQRYQKPSTSTHHGKRISISLIASGDAPSNSTSKKLSRRSVSDIDVPTFDQKLKSSKSNCHPLVRRGAATLQVNIGLTCNLACRHCHVESSPSRTETMSRVVSDRLIQLASNSLSSTSTSPLKFVDITGGAPEIHSEFRYLVEKFHSLGLSIIDRCNLAVIHEPTQKDLPLFLAKHSVRIIASLPCYTSENVEKQRGDGVFSSSIHALQILNNIGYGKNDNLILDLVYNPIGPHLPPPQDILQNDYKKRLKDDFGIVFNSLICITNMPIKRFADDLNINNGLNDYVHLLESNFNMNTVQNVMCSDMVHVAYDGTLYDCDFNYALEMGVPGPKLLGVNGQRSLSVFDIESVSELVGRRIATGKHCYGCTAGSGSSCGGSLT